MKQIHTNLNICKLKALSDFKFIRACAADTGFATEIYDYMVHWSTAFKFSRGFNWDFVYAKLLNVFENNFQLLKSNYVPTKLYK